MKANMNKFYLGTDEGIRRGGREVKGAVESSSTVATWVGKAICGAVLTSRAGRATLHGHSTCDSRINADQPPQNRHLLNAVYSILVLVV